MRAVVTRVSEASVSIDGQIKGQIKKGFLVLLGVHVEDTREKAIWMADRICGLRVFEDENGKMNRSLLDIGGQMLVISQFTLFANCRHGNRPDFLEAAPPSLAEPLYLYFVRRAREQLSHVGEGQFGATMEVSLVNHGPVTIQLDTELWQRKN